MLPLSMVGRAGKGESRKDTFWVIPYGTLQDHLIFFYPLCFPHIFVRKTHAHLQARHQPISEGDSDCGLGEGTAESF